MPCLYCLQLKARSQFAPAGQFDLVMANILRGPLLELQPRLSSYCRPGGRLLLSGVLAEQVRELGGGAAWGNGGRGGGGGAGSGRPQGGCPVGRAT